MKWMLMWLVSTNLVYANDSAVNAGGSDPGPLGKVKGEESVIRMVSERIDIHFGKENSKIHCRFVFRSTKPGEPAKQLVGFSDRGGANTDQTQIENLVTKVNGKEMPSKKELGWFADYQGGIGPYPATGKPDEVPVEFHTVEVVFPPDQDVVIERIYEVGNGGSVMGDSVFTYTTATGAIWKGTIGRAEFHITLDGWTIDDLAFEDGPQKVEPRKQMEFSSPNKSEWKIESPTRMSLVWENFEPAVHSTRRGITLKTWIKPELAR